MNYNQDIEILHSEIEEKLLQILDKKEDVFKSPENILVFKAYVQLMFVFASVINEIQNGKPSEPHIKLAKKIAKNDVIITFNWDTIMDRAMQETTGWKPDNGYLVRPSMIYRDKWVKPSDSVIRDFPAILKLHGSTNWLTSCLRPDGDKLKSIQETPTDDFYVYESTINPYSTYNGRYMSGYTPYSYGYYPPNIPLQGEKVREDYLLLKFTISPQDMPEPTSSSEGLISMPLIIPPVKHKTYSYFRSIFSHLWYYAEQSLIKAERIIIIGYSFPATDTQTDTLFKNAFVKRSDMPKIIIVDPFPDNIISRFVIDYGIREENIAVHRSYFSAVFNIDELFN